MIAADYTFQWRCALSLLPVGVSEVVSHPGHVDAELRDAEPGLVEQRAVDLDALVQRDTRKWLGDQGATLISFAEL